MITERRQKQLEEEWKVKEEKIQAKHDREFRRKIIEEDARLRALGRHVAARPRKVYTEAEREDIYKSKAKNREKLKEYKERKKAEREDKRIAKEKLKAYRKLHPYNHSEHMKKFYEDNPRARQEASDRMKKRHEDNPELRHTHSKYMKEQGYRRQKNDTNNSNV